MKWLQSIEDSHFYIFGLFNRILMLVKWNIVYFFLFRFCFTLFNHTFPLHKTNRLEMNVLMIDDEKKKVEKCMEWEKKKSKVYSNERIYNQIMLIRTILHSRRKKKKRKIENKFNSFLIFSLKWFNYMFDLLFKFKCLYALETQLTLIQNAIGC